MQSVRYQVGSDVNTHLLGAHPKNVPIPNSVNHILTCTMLKLLSFHVEDGQTCEKFDKLQQLILPNDILIKVILSYRRVYHIVTDHVFWVESIVMYH